MREMEHHGSKEERIWIHWKRRLIEMLDCVGERVALCWLHLGDTNNSDEDNNKINLKDVIHSNFASTALRSFMLLAQYAFRVSRVGVVKAYKIMIFLRLSSEGWWSINTKQIASLSFLMMENWMKNELNRCLRYDVKDSLNPGHNPILHMDERSLKIDVIFPRIQVTDYTSNTSRLPLKR